MNAYLSFQCVRCLLHSVLFSAHRPPNRCETVVMGSRGLGITKRALLNLLAVGSGRLLNHRQQGLAVLGDPARCPACPLWLRQAHSKPVCKGLASWCFG